MDHLRTHVCCQIARGRGRGHFDRLLNARVGHKPTQISAHRGVNIRITGGAVLLQQTWRLYDLPRLAVATLWCLRRYPSLLQRMLTRSAQTLNGGNRRIRNTAYQGDAGTLCYAVNMYGADSAHANTSTDLVPLRSVRRGPPRAAVCHLECLEQLNARLFSVILAFTTPP